MQQIKKHYQMECFNFQEIMDVLATKIAEHLKTVINDNPTKEMNDQEKWFTVEQVCKQLHITKGTLYNHRNKGLIKPAKYVGRKPLFNQQSIDNYLNNFTIE